MATSLKCLCAPGSVLITFTWPQDTMYFTTPCAHGFYIGAGYYVFHPHFTDEITFKKMLRCGILF